MRRATPLLVLALAQAACHRAPAAQPSPPESRAPIESRADTGGPHRLLIERGAYSDTAERLLRTAEATYPPRTELLAVARGLTAADSVAPELWWSTYFDGVRQPYAVTAGAVRYYTMLSDAYRAGSARSLGAIGLQRSSFIYRATIERVPEFEAAGARYRDVYVARLYIHWYGYCGDLCAQSVRKERTVVLTPDGRVLTVLGDGAPMIVVS